MATPISITTITSETPTLKVYDYTISINYNMRCYDKPMPEGLNTYLDYIFQDWSDGRHPLPVEIITIELERLLLQAFRNKCDDICHDKYEGETVQVSPSTQVGRWSIESEKMFKELRECLPYIVNDGTVTIVEKEKNE